MPRRSRFYPAGFPVHIIQRGNNRQADFASGVDLAAMLTETPSIDVLAKVHHFANTWVVLGTESFREQVHSLCNYDFTAFLLCPFTLTPLLQEC